jgi:hypothetical protein
MNVILENIYIPFYMDCHCTVIYTQPVFLVFTVQNSKGIPLFGSLPELNFEIHSYWTA